MLMFLRHRTWNLFGKFPKNDGVMGNLPAFGGFPAGQMLIRCVLMKWSNFFHKKVRLPIWPLIPLVIVGIVPALGETAFREKRRPKVTTTLRSVLGGVGLAAA
jgi:hypothetical protein